MIVRERQLHLEWGFDGWMKYLEYLDSRNLGAPRTAHEAVEMASCPQIRGLGASEMDSLPLTNARLLVRAWRAASASGKAIPEEVVRQALELRPRDFRREVSAEEGAAVRVWVADKAAAGPIERVCRVLATASPDAIVALADWLESDELVAVAGGGGDNLIDCVLGYITTTVREGIVEEAEQGTREWVNGVPYEAYYAQE
jgi:hypothetical protein